ncbi:MAG: hypothetical protein CMF51_05250 [Legionellales bacterium]|mgnify:CR=1 FL=1|nr:hypothetical protein [Legionellales bacterium]
MSFDVIICGSGVMGLSTAILLADLNYSVALIAPRLPNENPDNPMVHALNPHAIKLLKQCHIWDQITPAAMTHLSITDPYHRIDWSFEAATCYQPYLSLIISVSELTYALWTTAQTHSNIQCYTHVSAEQIDRTTTPITLTLSDNQTLQAPLVIGADGRNSWLRHQLHCTLLEQATHQKAIVAHVTLEQRLNGCGWQRFLPTGPLALLPQPDPHQAALIWSLNLDTCEHMLEMTSHEFNSALTEATQSTFGHCQLSTSRFSYPLTTQISDAFFRTGCVLIGDAAHSIHPVLGQGANLGFLDIETLIDCIETARTAGRIWHHDRVLARYQRHRKPDAQCMAHFAHHLNQIASKHPAWLGPLSRLGLAIPGVKTTLMRYASGERFILSSTLHR